MYDLFLSPLVMASALRLMTPVLFAAMGGSFGHKAKVLCLGLESFMAFAAFFAMYGSYTFESAYAGLLFGVLSAMIASCIFAVFVLIFKSTPVIVGIALNLAAWGGTTYLLSMIFKTRGVFIDPQIKSFGSIDIPLIKDIPYIGKFLSGQNILVYLSLVFMIIAYIIMFKTPFGLRLRGVGIKKIAAQTVGVNATKYQFIAILIGGMLCGFGGSCGHHGRRRPSAQDRACVLCLWLHRGDLCFAAKCWSAVPGRYFCAIPDHRSCDVCQCGRRKMQAEDGKSKIGRWL